ncbi:MAG TPA: TraB/GumN family protein [Rhodanobacter sp.]|nr:TraB/GumN family protein [Rhodanobacter sp.]
MRLTRVLFLLVLGGVAPVFAQSTAATAPPLRSNAADLPAVVVSGVQPGPGMWKVSRGDHVMWVLGTLSPLPRRMQWESHDLSQVIRQSQQVLLAPSLKLKADIGFFGKLFLLPAAYSARKNDHGETLQQVLPAPEYARWQVLKQKYLGHDRGIERWRPIFAAQKLYKKALKANGLSNSGGVGEAVDALAKQFGVKEIPVTYQAVIEQPRAAIKAFKRSGVNDTECFSRTMDSIEQNMPAIMARANAWATGDLQALRQLPDSDRRSVCVSALADAGFAHQLGLDDLPARLEAAWLAAADAALQANRQTFAMLPMKELLLPGGYLDRLKAQGYAVESPEDQDAAPAAGSSIGTPGVAVAPLTGPPS